MKLRILVILPLSGGSLTVGLHLAEAIQSHGNIELDYLFMQPLLDFYEKSFRQIEDNTERQIKISEHLNTAALAKVVEFKPDLLLVMALAPISPWLIENVRQLGVLTAHWYVENFRYFPAHPLIPKWQIIAPCYNYFFTIQKGQFFETLKEQGIENFYYLPTGCNPRIHKWLPDRSGLERQIYTDISFVGAPYPNRVALFKELAEFNPGIWGPGWSKTPELRSCCRSGDRWINSDEECKILNSAKIALNIHSSLFPGQMIERNDFLNPRVFTIPACGAFQLVDDQDLIAEVFEINKELAVYHDLSSLKEQFQYYLSHSGERAVICRAGYERVLSEHTYSHRFEQMLRIMNLV
jgi:spore maturation protein CgeB